MTAKWTDADLRTLDLKYAEANIRPHARPLRAAIEILGGGFSISPFGNPEVDAVVAAYRTLFPQADATWPGAGVGLAASGDDVRPLIWGVAFGSPGPIETWKALGFRDAQVWRTWCRDDPAIAAQTELAFADLYDFATGLNALGRIGKPADDLWHMAESNLADAANNLPTATGVDSIVQPVCLIAELSLKAALHCAGVEPKKKHDLPDLASKLANVRPHRDDTLIAKLRPRFIFSWLSSRVSLKNHRWWEFASHRAQCVAEIQSMRSAGIHCADQQWLILMREFGQHVANAAVVVERGDCGLTDVCTFEDIIEM